MLRWVLLIYKFAYNHLTDIHLYIKFYLKKGKPAMGTQIQIILSCKHIKIISRKTLYISKYFNLVFRIF